MQGSETQRRHESMYQKTIDGALRGIETGSFTDEGAARVLTGLRAELGQCIELLLISPEFYSLQMARLQEDVALVMQR